MAIITISGEVFSGRKDLAKCVAERLGLKCLSEEVLEKASRRYGVALEQLSHALEDKPGFFEGMAPERVHALAYIRAALFEEIKNGGVVYYGHAGNLLLKDVPHVLKIGVIGNMESRIKTAMHNRNLGRDQAIELIKKADETRGKLTKFLFHDNWLDPLLHDIMINLEFITIPSACELVCRITNHGFQPTPESQKRLADLILSSIVRARIAADETIEDAQIEIESDGGVITIKGTMESAVEADKLRKVVRQSPGVREINSQLRLSL